MKLAVPPAIAKIAPDGNLTPRQRRHLMLERIKQRVKPGSGSALLFLKQRTTKEKWHDLREILEGIPWVMVGGVATRAFMPERRTKDMEMPSTKKTTKRKRKQ